MFGSKVKLPQDLFDRAKRQAEAAGYGSVDELVARAVEKELERMTQEVDDEETKKRLEGLGYIS